MQHIIQRSPSTDTVNLPTDIHPILKRIYANRNISSADELDYSLQNLLPYQTLSNINDAVKLLTQHIKANKKILIVADFDADGATSCALAIRGLKQMGVANITYIVPNRFEFSYGLSVELTKLIIKTPPDLLITVDNGISSVDGVRLAREYGIDVLITDHHLPGKELPNANVIINPNQPSDIFPSKMLAGVGVMFYVLIALRAHLVQQQWFQPPLNKPNLANLLDLVALGTVADVVPMDKNNRLLIAQGIARIRSGKCCYGIKALLRLAKRTMERVSAADLGFAVAPRLNAAGRLADMSLGIQCLLSNDAAEATAIAEKLDQLNRERRAIQNDIQQQALAEISKFDIEKNQMPLGICLFNSDWHQGVIGIIAAKIKEKVSRPVIVFTQDTDSLLKGSARSISSINIRDVLEAIATKNLRLIDTFGGHAMAAGLSLRKDNYTKFKQAFEQEMAALITTEDLNNKLYSDGELTYNDIHFELANTIAKAGPWGQGFPEPQFDGKFELLNSKIVAEKHLKLQLSTGTQDGRENTAIDAICFNFSSEDWPKEPPQQVHIVYRLGVNDFRGQRNVQLIVENIQAVIN